MSREDERHLSTADFLEAREHRDADRMPESGAHLHDDPAVRGDAPMHHEGAMHHERSMQGGAIQREAQAHQDAMHPGTQRTHDIHHAQDMHSSTTVHKEPLAALFQGNVAEDFRHRWDAIQIGFVDDPREAVRHADELVAQVMKSLAETFAEQRSEIEARIGQAGQTDTENLRVALQRYRSFFQRLLSL